MRKEFASDIKKVQDLRLEHERLYTKQQDEEIAAHLEISKKHTNEAHHILNEMNDILDSRKTPAELQLIQIERAKQEALEISQQIEQQKQEFLNLQNKKQMEQQQQQQSQIIPNKIKRISINKKKKKKKIIKSSTSSDLNKKLAQAQLLMDQFLQEIQDDE